MADDKKPPAPVREIGYLNDQPTGWYLDLEPIPELAWPQSIQVYDDMRTDSQVVSVLRAVTLPVRRTRWSIDPAGARPEVTQHVADDLGLPIQGATDQQGGRLRTKDRFSWSDHLPLALLHLVYGHMPFEQVYRLDEAANRLHLRKLAPRMPRTISKLNVARDGGLISIEQAGAIGVTLRRGERLRPGPIVIPANRLVMYVNEREGANWFGRSLLRPAYRDWVIKDELVRGAAITVLRNGLGVPWYTAAEGETDLTKGQEAAQSFRAGDTSGGAGPHGSKMELLAPNGTLPDALPYIRYHDEQIARAVLAHFLNLGTQTGSWALGSTFADFFTLSLQAVAEQVATTANQYVIEDLVDVNYGTTEPAPRLVFEEIGSRVGDLAHALKLLVDAGVIRADQNLEDFMRNVLHMPPAAPAAGAA